VRLEYPATPRGYLTVLSEPCSIVFPVVDGEIIPAFVGLRGCTLTGGYGRLISGLSRN